METLIRTKDLPVSERFDAWSEHMSRMVAAPVRVTADDPVAFHGELGIVNLGIVNISSVEASPCQGYRTQQMIRQADPEMLVLTFNSGGKCVITQDREENVLKPDDLFIYHTSRPCRVQLAAGGDATRSLSVALSSSSLSISARKLASLTGVPLSGRCGIGALIVGLVTELIASNRRYRTSDLVRLEGVLIDLIAIFAARELETGAVREYNSYEHTFLLRIHTFIREHLADPELSPEMVAAANGISIRSLHRLFRSQDVTVAGWIRARRLERCRRDLADPAYYGESIGVIAARWGFTSASHFANLFRKAYGVSPRDHRHQSRIDCANRIVLGVSD
ncbi:helix-turn-helix domain-containing protein [Actinomadura sp. HBU206391]|uniref:helix-turn-helix domain-containing protein n=1 Tax=Actinomadura sp. HBU206391 TaxID=2731692 RepID=UPI001650D29F|nr:helix-turn-helix domain-containing protein [Actinomadura sp. HBU206391]MBC6459111.1 helix-turn-helix domain-containing protein [Actinomadura sp. HBU206391]